MGKDGFFVDPYGDVLACNGMDEKMPMGNLKEQGWDEIWGSQRAMAVREAVKGCGRNCWMIGSAAPAMRARLWRVAGWVVRGKVALKLKKEVL